MTERAAISRFHQYARAHELRLVRTGVGRLIDQLSDADPDSVEWLVENAAQLAARAVQRDGLEPGTAYTYASRLRGAGHRYLTATSSDSKAGPKPRADRSVREQLDEAYAALSRWPDLRRFLAGALANAEKELLPGSGDD